MKNSKYDLKDISVIIPSYNRSDDLKITLKSFGSSLKGLHEVIIIDQSTNDETEKLVKSIKNSKIKYFRSKVPSLTKSRNIGIKKASKKVKIIGFLDDDVSLSKGYFENICGAFDNERIMAVSGWYLPRIKINKFDILVKKIFFLEHFEPKRARVLSVYGATYPYSLKDSIKSEWISGFNMFFKKEVFSEFTFDENLKKYSLAEDFDFTYRISKKYPGSLIITPRAKIVHRVSNIERMPAENISYMNQINHFYLNFKNFNSNTKERLIFLWSVMGISFLRTMQFIKTRKIKDALKLKFFVKSLFYCIKNLRKIKMGKLEIPQQSI